MTAMPRTGGGFGRGGRPGESARVNSAVRGAGLIGLAVILGIVLLQVVDKGPSGSSSTAAGGTSKATTSTTKGGATASSQPGTTKGGGGAKARGEVRVLVFNAGA